MTVATRYAAVDTGALEGLYATTRGFTRTIAEQTATWEAALSLHGIEVARAIEDALAGYNMVLDLVTGREPLSQSWIRQLHERLLRSQTTFTVFTVLGPQTHPMPKGVYKTQPHQRRDRPGVPLYAAERYACGDVTALGGDRHRRVRRSLASGPGRLCSLRVRADPPLRRRQRARRQGLGVHLPLSRARRGPW
ncbi:hypothetical protein GCM10009810_31790 [Nostocoides vanveenii]|uniref:Uncharacterized protein n=1 Tax=Nostocoides vanveenii TaxID=330835 RepID=A0ABN2L2C2_9MICO